MTQEEFSTCEIDSGILIRHLRQFLQNIHYYLQEIYQKLIVIQNLQI